MYPQVNEADWKLFRSRLPGWHEAYMEKLLCEYAAMLASSDKASEKFWELEKRIKTDRRHVGVVAEMSRSRMNYNIISLLNEGAITLDDLEGFSDELREKMAYIVREE